MNRREFLKNFDKNIYENYIDDCKNILFKVDENSKIDDFDKFLSIFNNLCCSYRYHRITSILKYMSDSKIIFNIDVKIKL